MRITLLLSYEYIRGGGRGGIASFLGGGGGGIFPPPPLTAMDKILSVALATNISTFNQGPAALATTTSMI